jgi:hypothetical protein
LWQAGGCGFAVLNAYGSGFLGKVRGNALAPEPRKAGLAVDRQRGLTVLYYGAVVGDYSPDLMVAHGSIRVFRDIAFPICVGSLLRFNRTGPSASTTDGRRATLSVSSWFRAIWFRLARHGMVFGRGGLTGRAAPP